LISSDWAIGPIHTVLILPSRQLASTLIL